LRAIAGRCEILRLSSVTRGSMSPQSPPSGKRIKAFLLAAFGVITLTGFAGGSIILMGRMRRRPPHIGRDRAAKRGAGTYFAFALPVMMAFAIRCPASLAAS